MAFVTTHEVDRFVARDRVEPRSESLSGFKLANTQMNAQKGALENVFGMLNASEKSA
jgi:hypothetical protein